MSVYGQTELTKDLIDALIEAGAQLVYGAADVSIEDYDRKIPTVRYRHGGRGYELSCDFIAGCDGYHGVCRRSIPASSMQSFERVYPFGWLGILADVPPVDHELIYSNHAARIRLMQHALSEAQPLLRAVQPGGRAGCVARQPLLG